MKEVKLPRVYLTERRNQIILELHKEGFSCGDISEMLNNLDRTWIWRITRGVSKQKKAQK